MCVGGRARTSHGSEKLGRLSMLCIRGARHFVDIRCWYFACACAQATYEGAKTWIECVLAPDIPSRTRCVPAASVPPSAHRLLLSTRSTRPRCDAGVGAESRSCLDAPTRPWNVGVRCSELRQKTQSNAVIMLCGNKRDLPTERQVREKEAQSAAAMMCFPSSSLHRRRALSFGTLQPVTSRRGRDAVATQRRRDAENVENGQTMPAEAE